MTRAAAGLRLLRERRAADAVHARGHDLHRLLPRGPAGASGAGAQPAARAVVRAGGDRGGRQPGDQRRAGVARAASWGSEYFTSQEVEGIRVDGDRASGITLADGTTVSADVVISGLGVPQTVLRLLDGFEIEERLRHRIRNIHYDRGQLIWANLALHEPPRYSADGRQPGPGAAAAAVLGAEGPRLHGAALPGRDLPARARGAAVRAQLGRHALGSVARARGQAPRRGRGVRGPAADVLARAVGGDQAELLRPPARRVAALRAEHDAGQRDRRARVRAGRHRGQAARHDPGRLLGRQHDRFAARPLPAGARSCRATGCCSRTSTTARPTCTRARASGAARATTASRPSRATSGWRTRRRRRPWPGHADARSRDRARRAGWAGRSSSPSPRAGRP